MFLIHFFTPVLHMPSKDGSSFEVGERKTAGQIFLYFEKRTICRNGLSRNESSFEVLLARAIRAISSSGHKKPGLYIARAIALLINDLLHERGATSDRGRYEQ